MVRLGVNALPKSRSYSVIERNAFVDCDTGAESPLIAAGAVRVTGNTFRRCIGGPVLLHGTDSILSDNYIVDDGTSSPPPPSGGQTLGVGGIARPAPAENVELNGANRGDMNITVSGTASVPRIYDGGGFTCGRVTVNADYILLQNYNIRPGSQYGVFLTGSHITIQNCDIGNVVSSGGSDIVPITVLNGSFNKLLFNTAVNFVSGSPSSAGHTYWLQTYVSSDYPTACTNIQVVGNKAVGPANPSRDPAVASIHRCLMVEGAGHGGRTGGTGNPTNWYVADNEFGDSYNAGVKLDGAANFIFTRNRFTGSSDQAFTFVSQSGSLAYSDNVIGGGYGAVGVTLTGGSGPATSPY